MSTRRKPGPWANEAARRAVALGLQKHIDQYRNIGGVVGTLVSAVFLLGIAIVNIVILRSVYGTFTRVRRGEPYVDEDLDLLLANRGFLALHFIQQHGIGSAGCWVGGGVEVEIP